MGLVTVLTPKGVPTPLAPTYLVPPDSLMAALPADQMQTQIMGGKLYAKYAETVDPQSAHEIISARIAAAQAAVAGGAGEGAAGRAAAASVAAQQREMQRQIERYSREAAKEAQREARDQAKAEAAAARASERERLQRQRMIGQVGKTVLRGVMGTLFGSSRRRW